RKAFDAHLRKGGHARWEEIPMTQRHLSLVEMGERICEAIGVDPIPREKVHFTRDMRDSQLAVTCLDTRHVWFSTNLAARGEDEFLAGYIEEAVHAMTGARDCTREVQNVFLAQVVATQRHASMDAAWKPCGSMRA